MLVGLLDQRPGGTGTGQGHGTPGKLFDLAEASLALAPHQRQRHLVENWRTAADAAHGAGVKQLARRCQVTLAASQCAQQLFLGAWDELELNLLAIGGTGIEVMLQGAQAIVFDTDRLTLDLA